MNKAVLELLIKAIERTVVGNYSTMSSASIDEVFSLLEEAEKELAKTEEKEL